MIRELVRNVTAVSSRNHHLPAASSAVAEDHTSGASRDLSAQQVRAQSRPADAGVPWRGTRGQPTARPGHAREAGSTITGTRNGEQADNTLITNGCENGHARGPAVCKASFKIAFGP